MTENNLTDSELTWDMLEEETLGNLSDKPTKVAENVRREVALLFRTPSFMRDIAHELMLMNPSVKYNSDNNYVKIDDLKEIVGNLMSRNVVGQSLVMLEDSNKHFATTIHHMAENLLQLNVRVNQLAKELQEIAQDLETVSKDKKEECDPMPIRLTGGATNTTFGTQQCVTKPDKLRIYNDLICKYNNQRMDRSSNDFSSYSGSSSKSKIAEPLTRLKTETFWSQPSEQLSELDSKCPDTESTTKLRSDYARRVAERRQFEMNMLMYRKSQFSLKLNHRTENFPFSLWNRRYTSEHFNMPHTFQ